MQDFLHWIRKHYKRIVGSIAFYPAIIALSFLLISILMLQIDASVEGKDFKLQSPWIRLRDADTARIIVSTITAGILTLTVFSFSMVMIVLNQAAAYMSNRILQNLVGNRSQQIILGIYIGTIMYALFLLSSIRDIDSGTSIPALSIFLLILLTIIDIFIFIYFLHFITQSIQFQNIIHRIEKETLESIQNHKEDRKEIQPSFASFKNQMLVSPKSGYYQGFNKTALLKKAVELDLLLEIFTRKGSFILEGTPLLTVHYKTLPSPPEIKKLLSYIDFYEGQPLEQNPVYGFRQLTEVAIKALSSGINDPSTAVLSLNAIARLLTYKLHEGPLENITDENEHSRIIQQKNDFADLIHLCLQPVWNYGRKDQFIQEAFEDLLVQLRYISREEAYGVVIDNMLMKVRAARAGSE